MSGSTEQRVADLEHVLLGKPGEPGLDEVARTIDGRVSRLESHASRTFWLIVAVGVEVGVAFIVAIVRGVATG